MLRHRFQILAALLLVVISAASLPARAQRQEEVAPDEYKVYEAVFGLMDHIPKQDPHVTIFNVTLNSKCGKAAYPAPLVNDCTFLWIKPDTAKSVKRLLHEEWTQMQDSTWAHFERENANSGSLREPISSPWKHKLIGPGDEPSKDWDSPDMTIFLSRVGLNQGKTEAIVYVLTFSYMDQVSTEGDYFLFRTDKNGHWQPKGRMTYFTKDKNQSAQ